MTSLKIKLQIIKQTQYQEQHFSSKQIESSRVLQENFKTPIYENKESIRDQTLSSIANVITKSNTFHGKNTIIKNSLRKFQNTLMKNQKNI